MEPAEVRSLFPIMEDRTYLFSGGHSPASRPAIEAIQRLTDQWGYRIADLYANSLQEEAGKARRLFAGLIGADESEVAILDSTGAGSNLAVELIEPRDGGNVVFDEWSYPSSIFPWMLPPRAAVERSGAGSWSACRPCSTSRTCRRRRWCAPCWSRPVARHSVRSFAGLPRPRPPHWRSAGGGWCPSWPAGAVS